VATDAMRVKKMPDLTSILGGRRLAMKSGGSMTSEGMYPYFFFCNAILECVAGKKEWKREKNKKKVTESSVTVSDEAFALLLLVNSWDKLAYLADNVGNEEKALTPETLYTEKKGRNRKLQGWTTEGIEKFNNLCLSVIEDRASKAGKTFETDFLAYQEEQAKKDKTKMLQMEEDDSIDGTGGDDNARPVKQMKYAFNHLKDLAGVGLTKI
jgi:hypothetical protein